MTLRYTYKSASGRTGASFPAANDEEAIEQIKRAAYFEGDGTLTRYGETFDLLSAAETRDEIKAYPWPYEQGFDEAFAAPIPSDLDTASILTALTPVIVAPVDYTDVTLTLWRLYTERTAAWAPEYLRTNEPDLSGRQRVFTDVAAWITEDIARQVQTFKVAGFETSFEQVAAAYLPKVYWTEEGASVPGLTDVQALLWPAPTDPVLDVIQAARDLYDNRLGHAPGACRAYAPISFWDTLGVALKQFNSGTHGAQRSFG